MGFIYLIICNRNLKVYIGQTIHTLESRWSQHKTAATHYVGPHKLYNAISQYGANYFKLVKLLEINDEYLKYYEHEYIKIFNSIDDGYNTNNSTPVNIPNESINLYEPLKL